MTGNLRTRSGWVTFAGVGGLVVGGDNALRGIAALADDDTVAAQAKDVLFGIDLTLWGWFWLFVVLTLDCLVLYGLLTQSESFDASSSRAPGVGRVAA